jgi:hypothetical protein
LLRSDDGGATWSDPVLVNDDGTPTEHGFVSLWPDGDDGIAIAWLDGRNMHGDGAHTGHGGGEAMMTLHSARFDATLSRHDERELDASVCDCCQTDSALTDRGRLLVYRDRTDDEIRDIYAVTREDGAGWGTPRRVHADDWTMPACPVNGPAVAARGSDAIVGWYTAAGGTPRVLVARSTDAGDSFAAPLELDAGAHVQGRISVALGTDAAWALWTTRGTATARPCKLVTPRARPVARTAAHRGCAPARGGDAPPVSRNSRWSKCMAFVAWTDVVGQGGPA